MTAIPSETWRMLANQMVSKPLPKGLDATYDTCIGFVGKFVPRKQKNLRRAEKILLLEKEFSGMPEVRLCQVAEEMRERFRCRRDTPSDLNRAFAFVREVAFRQIGEKPFLTQVAGALAIESGCIAEMATGEGKTLTCTMPATVAGWRGKGCHIITVNDYLARRDAEWMERIYRFCGLTVAHIDQQSSSDERRLAYHSDITYCTNKDVTADFLRDRLLLGRLKDLSSVLLTKIAGTGQDSTGKLLQRGLHYAIVDEADSILIDEAVTPLIISGPAPNPELVQSFSQAASIAAQLLHGVDYLVDQRYREIKLTDQGERRLEELTAKMRKIWKGRHRKWEMLNQALMAKELYQCDKHYVIEDKKVVIVFELTGRLMPDRSWRDGMHQAVEAKENVEINPPKDTYARVSFQRFFRMYDKLSGMTGTADEAVMEFWQIYHLPVVTIPENRPCIRKDMPTIVLATEQKKWEKIVEEIRRINDIGRPVLVGTRSIRASKHLSQLLKAEKIDHQVLNAVYHQQEAQIVAQAGQLGKVTVATNMAGRGTNIKLGKGVAELGGLHVIGAESNESVRIDRQLFGRSARQGAPGTTQEILSIADELVSQHAKYAMGYLKKKHADTEENISSALVRKAFDFAQARAERLAIIQRKAVLKTDHWLDEQLGFTGTE